MKTKVVKIVCFLLTAIFFFSIPAYAASTSDSGMEKLFQVQSHAPYVSGIGNNKFGPDKRITRAETAQMLYNLLLEQSVVTETIFSDVPISSWYGQAVNALAQIGIFRGYGNGTFRPNSFITRAELVTALAACTSSIDADVGFSDVSEKHWARKSIAAANFYGWIKGYPDGTFRPNDPITRAETVTILNRALGRTGNGFAENRTGKYFTDISKKHWAYSDIVEASGAVAFSDFSNPDDKRQMVVTASGLNLRSGPDINSPVLVVLSKNTLLNCIDNAHAPWIHVSTQEGLQGYVHKDYIEEYVPNTNPAKQIKLSAFSATIAQYQSFRLDGISEPQTSLRWSSSDTSIVTVSVMRYGEGDESCFLYGKSPGTAVVRCSDYSGNALTECTVNVQNPEPIRFAYTEPNRITADSEAKIIAITDKDKRNVSFVVENSYGQQVLSQNSFTSTAEHYGEHETRVFQCPIKSLKPGEYRAKVSAGSSHLTFEFAVHTSEAFHITTESSRDISDAMIGLIMEYESYVPVVCDDAAAPKNPTVGYGFVVNTNESFYNYMTPREAKALLVQQIKKNYGSAVNNFREKYNLRMSQSQYDALVSFTYNLGPGYINDPTSNSLFTSILNAVVPPDNLNAAHSCPAVLNVKNADLFATPSKNGKVKSTVKRGSALQVIGVQRNAQSKELWYQVKVGSDSGWMRGGNISLKLAGAVHDLNYVDSMTFSTYLLQYHHVDTACKPGLLYRRLREAKLFNHADYEQASSRNSYSTKNTYHYIYPDCMKAYE
ncbi:S-layer homology domain-containing protein [uncultured Neglectibacter sp.]|uniref:S-layer homology domain-containing protein n=1 Tax=uncultured Neglectibacter sp. TaxID=1924108 RepID=UPI0034E02EE9